MQIKFANSLQSHIADLMWDAKDLEMVKKIIAVYGKEYVGVVYAGRKPVKAELRDLAAEQRVVLEEQE